MCWTEAEAMQDAYQYEAGAEVDLGCPDCGESWVVHVYEGECLTDEQVRCPTEGCDGEGREL
jgi:hypothetical protein